MNSKNVFLVFFTLLFWTPLFSQKMVYFPNEYSYYSEYQDIRRPANIKEIIYNYNPVKGKVKVIKEEFDTNGNLVGVYVLDKNKELIPSIKASFTYTNKMESFTSFTSKGKIRSHIEMKYSVEKIASEIVKDKNGTIRKKYIWEYDSTGKLTMNAIYKGHKELKIKYKYLYEYNPDGQRVRTTLYDSKDKVKYIWSYDSHEEGVKLTKVKDMTQVCQWSVERDSFLIKVTQNFDEKGDVRKYIEKFNKKDTSLLERKTYNSKDEMIYLTTYNQFGHLTSFKRYGRGKMKSGYEKYYEDKKLVKYVSIKRKSTTQKLFQYDGENNLSTIIRIDKRGKTTSTTTLEMKFY